MVATTLDHFGRLDILINNAAITFIGDLDIPLHRFDLVMQVNMRAPHDRPPPGRPGHAGRRRGLGGQRLVGGRPLPPSLADGLRHVQDGPGAPDRRRRLPAGRRRASPSTASASTWRWPPRASWPTRPAPTTPNWEPSEVAAEGIVWMVRQPTSYSGRRESMFALRHREGIMASRVPHPATTAPPVELTTAWWPPPDRVRRAVSRRSRPRPDDPPVQPCLSPPSCIPPPRRSMSPWPSAPPEEEAAIAGPHRRTGARGAPRAPGWTPRICPGAGEPVTSLVHQRGGVQRDLRDPPGRLPRRAAPAAPGGPEGPQRDHAARVPGAPRPQRHRRAPSRGLRRLQRRRRDRLVLLPDEPGGRVVAHEHGRVAGAVRHRPRGPLRAGHRTGRRHRPAGPGGLEGPWASRASASPTDSTTARWTGGWPISTRSSSGTSPGWRWPPTGCAATSPATGSRASSTATTSSPT